MDIHEFLGKLEGVKTAGHNKWTAHCPVPGHNHGDRTNSLSISLADDGRILIHCHKGHTAEEICGAMALSTADLMPTPTQADKRRDSIEWMAGKIGMHVAREYDYCYGEYRDGLAKIRFEDGKGNKTFRWIREDSNSKSGYKWNHDECAHRLYCAGSIQADTVVVVEGEKDADTVHRVWNMTGVSAENGATQGDPGTKWLPEYTNQLQGKTVYILGDNDAPGRNFADIEANAIAGHAAHVFVLDIVRAWPECPAKGDITDMVHALGDKEAVRRLDALKGTAVERPQSHDNAAPAEDTANATETPTDGAEAATAPRKTSTELFDDFMGKIQTEAFRPMKTGMPALDSLLGGGIMRQSLVILNAAPAAGKTSLCQQIFEGMAANEHTDVLFLNLEMSRDQLLARSLSRIMHKHHNDMSATQIMQGYKWTDQQRRQVQEAADEYKSRIAPWMHYNPDDCGPNLEVIRQCLDDNAAMVTAQGRPAPVAVLDYLHLVTTDGKDDAQTVAKMAVAMLKEYALKWDTFVLAISANNRMTNASGKISLNSGRDSSALEYSADVQMSLNYKALHEGKDEAGNKLSADDPDDMARLQREQPRHMMVQVLKNRMGAAGNILYMDFDAEHSIFYPVDRFNTGLPQDGEFHSVDEYTQQNLDIPFI